MQVSCLKSKPTMVAGHAAKGDTPEIVGRDLNMVRIQTQQMSNKQTNIKYTLSCTQPGFLFCCCRAASQLALTSPIMAMQKVRRVRWIRSDCTSGDERSRLVSTRINTTELVSQTAMLRLPRALLYAIIGCNLFAARNTVCEPCLPLLACRHLLRPPTTSATLPGPVSN